MKTEIYKVYEEYLVSLKRIAKKHPKHRVAPDITIKDEIQRIVDHLALLDKTYKLK